METARRPPPEDRPRHEGAQPEEAADPAQASAAIEAESFGEVIEVGPDQSVDGDFNGDPELEGVQDTKAWEGVDALDAMEGLDREVLRESGAPEEVLADAVAARRSVLFERLDEARGLGLEHVFQAAIAATEPTAGNSPIVLDEEVLREHLETIDAALDELERKSAT